MTGKPPPTITADCGTERGYTTTSPAASRTARMPHRPRRPLTRLLRHPEGRAAIERYQTSPKGRVAQTRYAATPEGQAARRRANANRNRRRTGTPAPNLSPNRGNRKGETRSHTLPSGR